MALTKSQQAIIAKARSAGGGRQGLALSDDACAYLVGVIASDLGLLERLPEVPAALPAFFGNQPLTDLCLAGQDFLALFERLVQIAPDADTYFHCLAALHKARLKYERILQTQPIPTIDQVGPRGLLQYGTLSPRALTALLMWRKWLFDIDNRAGQETGYLFEPILAAAIGGVPVSAARSPIRRQSDPRKGRQVDCIRPDQKAYEIKIRVTIAASGQGRWREDLDFPTDCRASGFTPVLVVLDPTRNPKLDELQTAFRNQGGEVYIGPDTWMHFDALAGPTMARFLEAYVHVPLQALLAEVPATPESLPDVLLRMTETLFSVSLAGTVLEVPRSPRQEDEPSEPDSLPEDVDEQTPGP